MLNYVTQSDFAAGLLLSSARDSEPGVGLATARNALFDDDGDAYMRGGITPMDPYDAARLVDEPITFMWSGYLSNVARTLVCTATKAYSYETVTGFTLLSGSHGLTRPVLPAITGNKIFLPNGFWWNGTGSGVWTTGAQTHSDPVACVAAVADRLVWASGNKIGFSKSFYDTTVLAGTFPDFGEATDFHTLADGVRVLAMTAIRDSLLVFTTYGVWTIGNMSFDLTDAEGNVQQNLALTFPEMSLLSETGIAEWSGKIVAPMTDRIFLLDTTSAPIPIGDSIAPMWADLISGGLRPGGAKVFRNHYFLPLLDPVTQTPSGEMLVCRLNRPVRGRQIYYPWSVMDGLAGSFAALDVRLIDAIPNLTAGAALEDPTGYQIVNLTHMFEPGMNPDDTIGPGRYSFELELRDLPTGQGQPNHVRQVRVYATLKRTTDPVYAALPSPTINVSLSGGKRTQSFEDLRANVPDFAAIAAIPCEVVRRGGEASSEVSRQDPDRFYSSVGQITADNEGFDPVRLNVERAMRTRYARVFLRASAPCKELRVHRVEVAVRPATHQR